MGTARSCRIERFSWPPRLLGRERQGRERAGELSELVRREVWTRGSVPFPFRPLSGSACRPPSAVFSAVVGGLLERQLVLGSEFERFEGEVGLFTYLRSFLPIFLKNLK